MWIAFCCRENSELSGETFFFFSFYFLNSVATEMLPTLCHSCFGVMLCARNMVKLV